MSNDNHFASLITPEHADHIDRRCAIFTDDEDWIAAADTEDLRRILDEFGEHEPDSWEEFQRVDGDGILTVAVEPGSAVPAGSIVTKREKPHPCGGTLDCAAPARLWAEFGMRQGRDYTRRLVSSRNF